MLKHIGHLCARPEQGDNTVTCRSVAGTTAEGKHATHVVLPCVVILNTSMHFRLGKETKTDTERKTLIWESIESSQGQRFCVKEEL